MLNDRYIGSNKISIQRAKFDFDKIMIKKPEEDSKETLKKVKISLFL